MSRYHSPENLREFVIKINRNAKMLKGGRRFSFSAYVIVGDGEGTVGIGRGKAREVPMAVSKAVVNAKKRLIQVPLVEGGTIPHRVRAKYSSSSVVMVPARPGTGVIACATLRALCEAAGIHNILTKCYDSTNPINLMKAGFSALLELRSKEEVERLRGVSLKDS